MTAPIPILDQSLAQARALIGQPNGVKAPERAEYSDRGRTFKRVSAAEWRRLLNETLPRVNLLLLTEHEHIEDETLVVTFSLTHVVYGVTRTLTRAVPLTQAPTRALAAQWAHTRAVNAVARTLLWQWDDEDEAQDEPGEKVAATKPEESDGGPVRTELLAPGYRKGTTVWTMRMIEDAVRREEGQREPGDVADTSTVDVDGTRYYRARWSSARKTPWGSVSWLAWRTSTLEPAEFTCRRWTKVSGDWPAHPDDPKPEQDTRSMEEVMGGETLPDFQAPASGLTEEQKRGNLRESMRRMVTDAESTLGVTTTAPEVSPVATPDSPATCGGGAPSTNDAAGSPSPVASEGPPSSAAGPVPAPRPEADVSLGPGPEAPAVKPATYTDAFVALSAAAWDAMQEKQRSGADSAAYLALKAKTDAARDHLLTFDCEECGHLVSGHDGDGCAHEGDAGPDCDCEESCPDVDDVETDDERDARQAEAPLLSPNPAALVRTEEAAQAVAKRDTKPAKPSGAAIEMTYADGSVATIPVPPAAAKRMENRIASMATMTGGQMRAERWRVRPLRKARSVQGECAECGVVVIRGDDYREGVAKPEGATGMLSPRGVPYGKAHETCVERLLAGDKEVGA
jgi:hypothetical protein